MVSSEISTSGPAMSAEKRDRQLELWKICEAYVNADFGMGTDELMEEIGVTRETINTWRRGGTPRSLKTYFLSINPSVHTQSVSYLMERHGLSKCAVYKTMKVLGISPPPNLSHLTEAQRSLILIQPDLGKVKYQVIAERLGVTKGQISDLCAKLGIRSELGKCPVDSDIDKLSDRLVHIPSPISPLLNGWMR